MQLSKKMKDIEGITFGSLTAVKPLRLSRHGIVVWEWSCRCGSRHEATGIQVGAAARNATNPLVPSCGCVKLQRAIETSTKHGYSRHPLNAVWQSMKQRCYNPDHRLYPAYGGKGVTVCDEWLGSLESFIQWALKNGWVQGKHIDKDIGSDNQNLTRIYSPETCTVLDGVENVSYSASRSNYKNNSNIKLKPSDVTEIVSLYSTGAYSQRDIAKMFGVSQGTISAIIIKKTS